MGIGLPGLPRGSAENPQARHPLKERADWETYFQAQHTEHQRLTAEIVRLETELNAHVYALFGLTAEEIALIEASTKYEYGEV